MNYVYDDEDNYPMIDDERTGYYLEMMAEARMEDEENEREERRQKALEVLAIVIGLSEACRKNKCPWFIETAEDFLDEDCDISVKQMDYLKHMCVGCKGKETGKINPEHEEKILKEWKDLCEWVKNMIHGIGAKTYRCHSCPNIYWVYGKYKDPDDERKAIEELCCNCKYFKEE